MRRPTTIRRVVIPAAGLGTRLLSATKEQPKEMLPMFAREKGRLLVKPLLQLIFEQLHDFGILEFCFIVGREKRVIEDHFTPDNGYLKQLENRGKSHYVASLSEFYEKIKCSTIVWINQPEPLGFGHAVLQARSLFGEEPFLVHAGDTLVVSENHNHLERLLETHQLHKADATFIIQRVRQPEKYGVVEIGEGKGPPLTILRLTEKPEKPLTNLAIMPLYVFESTIFDALESTKPGKGGEIQLTDAMQHLIEQGRTIQATQLKHGEFSLDVGTAETYWEALRISYERAISRSR